jgi:MFS family permease
VRINETGNLRALRHRNYRILFFANATSNIGSWMQRIAQDWLTLELTHSGTYLGFVTAVQFLPVIFLSMHGGAFADRMNKRKVLIYTNIAGGISGGALGLLVVTHKVHIWHVFFFACTLGISNAIDNPVRQSFNSEIVGHDDVANAVSLNSANFNAGRLIGPAISGWLIAAFGTGPSFLINAFTYVFVVMALLKMREHEFFIKERKASAGKIREAWSYIQARPDLQAIMCIVFFQATFGLNFQIFNALSATKLFHRGPASFGLLGTMIAVGSLSGAILSARMERFKSPTFVIKGSIFFGSAITILSLMPNYTAYALWLPVCGFTALMTMIRANALMQIHSDPAIRGRVMGIYLFIFMGGTPFGSPIIGWMAEAIGVRPTIAIGGIVTALAAMTTWFIYRNQMQVPSDFSIDVVLPPTYNN